MKVKRFLAQVVFLFSMFAFTMPVMAEMPVYVPPVGAVPERLVGGASRSGEAPPRLTVLAPRDHDWRMALLKQEELDKVVSP